MPFQQLTFRCPEPALAKLEKLLFKNQALSLTLLDAKDVPILEPLPGEAPLWPLLWVRVLFEMAQPLENLKTKILNSPTLQADLIEENILEDQPWERAWLKHFKPMDFGHGLWICPTAYDPPDDPLARVIYLDPGLAFGTGTHPTTALCLQWLSDQRLQGKTVLDYGCGSGILALAARVQGSDKIIAVDIDPQALIATRANQLLNHIPESVIQTLLPEDFLNRSFNKNNFNLIIANILQGPLIQLSALFTHHLAPFGQLILSGLLETQALEIISCYQAQGLSCTLQKNLEGWSLLGFNGI